MIQKLEIHGVHAEVDKKLRDYVHKKIGRLDHYMSRHVRESVHAEVFLKESKVKNKKQSTCEVVLHLPQENITTSESTLNMFAAVDIVERKLKNQLKRYKDTHHSAQLHRRLYAKLRRRGV